MNRAQRQILTNFVIVTVVTSVTALGMVELKNWVNRSEAMRAMEQLGSVVRHYKQQNGSVPSQTYVDAIEDSLQGKIRLGQLNYRARWIRFDSSPDEILAYARKNYGSLFSHPGAIILRFDGRVEWMDKAEFDELLASQQSPTEVEISPK